MNFITFDISKVKSMITENMINAVINENKGMLQNILTPDACNRDDLGWVDIDSLAGDDLLGKIETKAQEIRDKADIFVLIGVGGSNQGARAVIEAMGDNRVEIIYAGNNLSPNYLNKLMARLEGKSVYVNVIAKNSATLEPGITFRVLRNYLEKRFGEKEAGQRIIATGSLNNSTLEVLGRDKGYALLPFPLDVGGRFSVLSAVGLLPVAVAGIDIGELIKGAKDIKEEMLARAPEKNPAVIYGALRNILLQKGYALEILACFEPALFYFSRWWIQLFGESEGKDGKGIYPTACSYTEDLHSLGQYIQEGRRNLFETFLNLEDQGASFTIPYEETDQDGFNYLNSQDFAYLNKTAFQATVKAHTAGGVPCLILNIPELTPYYMGQLFYFFEYACYVSASLLGVNPFNQPGVEGYKNNMFAVLKRHDVC